MIPRLSFVAHAQELVEREIDCGSITNPLLVPKCAFGQIPILIGWLLNMAIIAAGILVLGALILGGFYYTTAGDKPQRAEQGRTMIQWAVIGLIFVASAYVIMRTFAPMLGFEGVFSSVGTRAVYAQSETSVVAREDVTLIQLRGGVHDKKSGSALAGTSTTLYWLNPDGQWVLWPAREFDNQRNPFLTDTFGQYQFLVPAGEYYVTAERSGYYNTQSEPVRVEITAVRTDLALERAPSIWNYLLIAGVPVLVGVIIYIAVQRALLWQKKQQLRQQTLKKLQRKNND